MSKSRKISWIIAVNIVIMALTVWFVVQYAHDEAEELAETRVSEFEAITVTMEQVTANYLESEQKVCDVWARYISSKDMTLEEATEFIRSSHVSNDASAHLVYVDDGSLVGLSTRPRAGTEDDYDVSYKEIGLPIDLESASGKGAVVASRAYANPMNGAPSLAFCNRLILRDSHSVRKRTVALLRVVPVAKLQDKWVFPLEEYQSAEISLIDGNGNYIIKGDDYAGDNFLEFYASHNRASSSEVVALEKSLRTDTGTFFMANAHGAQCLIAHTPVVAAKNWTILNYIEAAELQQDRVDWALVLGVAGALLLLLAFDMIYMQAFNRRLQQAAREAESANRAKSDFLSAMSHDIRTPMNAILGLTAIAERNVDDTQVVQDSLRKISLAGNHLLTLINDVLDISKVESGKLALVPATFSIVEVAENLVNLAQPMVKEKSIDFAFRTNRIRHEYLYADQLRLNQIFINLLSNALKYTEPFGSVEVDLYELEGDDPSMVKMVYRVQDTGIGMSEEFMGRMYESFSRQADSRISTIQGTGLGLAITKQMVDLMGGTIECTSRQGVGTTFTVSLGMPVADHSIDDMSLASVDALLVDDDEILLETAKETLLSLDAQVETASSGAEAVEMVGTRHAHGNDYSIAIVDWKMPDMDGVEVVRRVRSLTGERVPILLISAYDWSDIEEAARAAGVNGFISKPLFRSTLCDKISELLGLAVEARTPDDDGDSDLAGTRVLVAEDNDVNWEILSQLLSMYGIASERAENGQVAVDKLAHADQGAYDLVFMDVQMPVMNGIEATKAIRALDGSWAASVPIIAATADAFSENVAECLAAGMDGHISKPIDVKLVLKEIRRVKEAS